MSSPSPLGRTRLTLATFAALAAGAACGDGASEGPAPGEAVWSADARSLVISSAGGGFIPTPPGSECDFGAAEHKLEFATASGTAHLTSVSCAASPSGGPLRKMERERDLTASELQALQPALASLIVVDEMTCGADKPEITLTVTTAAGTREYRDSFYSCVDDPRPTVASGALDEVLHRLSELAAP